MSGYKRIFYDTNPLIYYLEQSDVYLGRMKQFLKEQSEADADFVTSTITVGEYLTKLYKDGDEKLIADFKGFISVYDFDVVTISWEIAEEAAKIRGKYKGFKLMDSLQLATAKHSGCDAFVSNDLQLRQFAGLDILIVDEMPVAERE